MKLPKRGERGFTLVELLIVLAILAVLAAVVIPNVTGMFGRGAKQSFNTDMKTIQTGVAAFYFDIHRFVPLAGADAAAGEGWNEPAANGTHSYPTKVGAPSNLVTATALTLKATTGFKEDAYLISVNGGAAATDPQILAASIWMGLLVNLKGSADASDPDSNAALTAAQKAAQVSPVANEDGPYLNEFPQSSSAFNGNPAATPGSYTWIILETGQVVGASKAPLAPNNWYAGFNGTYP